MYILGVGTYITAEGRIASRGTRSLENLVCAELDLHNGDLKQLKTIKELSVQYDLLLSGGIGFSPSASYLLYPNSYARGNLVARNRLYLVDTRTWEEEKIMLDDKYSMSVRVGGQGRDANWYEWGFTHDEKDIYILAQEIDIDGMGRGMNTHAYLLLKLNFETKETQEILRIRRTIEMNNLSPWNRLALSPNENEIALLGLERHRGKQERYIVFRIANLGTKETRQIVYSHGGTDKRWGREIVWLSEKTVAIFLSERDEFFFGKIEEGK
ncbi:MAG: hypothetical protein FWG71_00610 [Synergistaceae bacterium]|nr:hypothetical protein [Synergistaceae bacterium]